MSFEFLHRTEILMGEDTVKSFHNKKVAVYGLGGVGATAAVDLLRTGVGTLLVFDFDIISISNLNRLVLGFRNNLGRNKTDVLKETAGLINPEAHIISSELFMKGRDASSCIPEDADFHIDAIDSLNPKVNLIKTLRKKQLPFVSVMGTAGRLFPEKMKISQMKDTDVCPLARVVRKRLRRIKTPLDFPVVWSDEKPVPPV
ncbi:MAG: ThiF family adenylyltransferase, partial [bacterium]